MLQSESLRDEDIRCAFGIAGFKVKSYVVKFKQVQNTTMSVYSEFKTSSSARAPSESGRTGNKKTPLCSVAIGKMHTQINNTFARLHGCTRRFIPI